MATLRFNRWIWIAALWLGLILFSSTSLARRIGERGYGVASRRLAPAVKSAKDAELASILAPKTIHFALFFGFGILLYLAIEPAPRKNLWILGIALIAGCASEWLQRFFPTRSPLLIDACLNFVSAAAGLCVTLLIRRFTAG